MSKSIKKNKQSYLNNIPVSIEKVSSEDKQVLADLNKAMRADYIGSSEPGFTTKSRGAICGEHMADSLVGWVHLMYQKATAKRVLLALIQRLNKRLKEFN